MASKRQLKKDVIAEVMALFDEACILRSVSPSKAMVSEIEDLMDDIMVFTDDTLRRIDHPDGKNNRKLVRLYYRTLRRHISVQLDSFAQRLSLFIDEE